MELNNVLEGKDHPVLLKVYCLNVVVVCIWYINRSQGSVLSLIVNSLVVINLPVIMVWNVFLFSTKTS